MTDSKLTLYSWIFTYLQINKLGGDMDGFFVYSLEFWAGEVMSRYP